MNSTQLKETQAVVYRVLSQSLLGDNVSQGYLFVGDKGTPMLETAKLLAKSILCTHRKLDGFACEECDSCMRVENENFTDLLILDGTESSIKKEMILQVRDTFSKTALEAYGKKVYIVNACENATPEALNSLLKFLEEPSDDVYAILITYRIESLLDTIISRVQNIKFRPLNVEQCVKQCVDKGVAQEDAEILSRIMANPELVNEITLHNSYIMIKSFVLEFLALFLKSEDLATIELQKFIRKNKNLGKSEYVLLLDILIVYCKECIAKSFEGENSWNTLVDNGSARDCHSYMRILLESKDEFQRYPNAALMFDKIMYRLKKGA